MLPETLQTIKVLIDLGKQVEDKPVLQIYQLQKTTIVRTSAAAGIVSHGNRTRRAWALGPFETCDTSPIWAAPVAEVSAFA